VSIAQYKPGSAVPITFTRFVTSPRVLDVSAAGLAVTFGDPNHVELEESICTPALVLTSLGSIHKAGYSLAHDISRIRTTQSFEAPDQVVTIRLDHPEYKHTEYDSIVVTFTANYSFEKSALTIQTSNADLEFRLPGFAGLEEKESSVRLDVAMVREAVISDPVGYMTLRFEGMTEFLPREAHAFGVNELHLQGKRAGDIIAHSRFGEDGLTIFGSVTSAKYLGNELVRSSWQLLSPELQAAIITAALGVLGYICVRTGPNLYRVYLRSVDRLLLSKADTGSTRSDACVPKGHLVLVLAHGGAIAGVAKKSPCWYRPHYLLADVYVCDGQNWRKGPSTAEVDYRQVAYWYVLKEPILAENPHPSFR